MSAVGLDPSARLELLAAEAGIAGLRADTLSLRLGVSDTETDRVISASRSIERVGDRLIATSALDALGGRIISIVKAHHAERPLDTGAPKQDVRSRLDLEAPVFEHIVARLARAKKVEAHAAELRVAGHGPALSQHQQKTVDEMLAVLDAAGNEPPSVSELQQRFGTQTHSLLRHLERQHRVVQVEDTRFYTAGAVRELLQKLAAHMAGNGEFAPAELREVLGFSRKFLIPFLEYCDKRGYTARHDGGRVWRGGNVPMSTTTT